MIIAPQNREVFIADVCMVEGGGGGGRWWDLNGGPWKKNMALKRDREGKRKIVGLTGVTKKIFKFFSDGICYNANSLQENRRF